MYFKVQGETRKESMGMQGGLGLYVAFNSYDHITMRQKPESKKEFPSLYE